MYAIVIIIIIIIIIIYHLFGFLPGPHLLYPLMAPHIQGLPPGLVMRMPVASSSETSTMPTTATVSRDRDAQSPHKRAETATAPRPHSHGPAETQLSYDKLVKLKANASERPLSAMVESSRGPDSPKGLHTLGRQGGGGRESTSRSITRTPDSGRDSSTQSRPSIICSNLAIRRGEVGVPGSGTSSPRGEEESRWPRSDAPTEEEMMRRQRLMAEYSGDVHQAMRMAHLQRYVQFDPTYG